MATNIQQYNVARANYRRFDGALVSSLNDSTNTKMELVPFTSASVQYAALSIQPVYTTPSRRISIQDINSVAGYGISRSWQIYSSQKLKHDIRTIVDGLSLILKLKPSNFRWNDDPTDKEDAGFIAEEISEVIPLAAAYDNDNVPIGIDATRIIPYLVAAVQQQQAQIEALTKQIELLSSNTEGL